MATPVELPQLGNTVEECIIAKWRRRAGDVVAAGEVVADIETDKTTFEVTAPVAGTVLAVFFDEGALIPVFTNILVIGQPGESVEAFRPHGAVISESVPGVPQAPAHPASARAAAGQSTAAAYSPRASRFAATHNFHPASLAGSGPGGRVLERDLKRAYDAHVSGSPVSPEIAAPARAVQRVPGAATTAETPATGLRATIARRMRESLASTAQYTLHASADASGLLAVRGRIKRGVGAADISISDLVAFCAIQALLDVPELNAAYVDGRIVRHREIHLAFAVDTPRGLLAPVVRDAHTLSLAALAGRTTELAAQAVQGTIAADDLTGGTFTISNLGALGVESFTPLLNPPQVAILGVGTIQPRVIRKPGERHSVRVRETSARRAMALTESIAFIDSIGLSLTCDHQVIDGAPGAKFLQVVRVKIESVESLVAIE